ncbi:MAG: hypothetical protein PHV77_07405 [Candidatus Omnitrophica bacterium]|nr:hypothetical protein [Candidatus Omnitrophota bacterium]
MGTHKLDHRSFAGIPLGFQVRKQLAKQFIYRVRRDNGMQYANKRIIHQDKYPYVVPKSIYNPESQPARDKLAQAVHNWRYYLSPAEKKEYNLRAVRRFRMAGYHLYISEFMLRQ